MHSERRMQSKVDVGELKEFIKNVRDPLECPPVPLCRREAKEALEYEAQFKGGNLRTEARMRAQVNKMISEMMRDKSRPTSQVKRPPPEETVKPVMRYSPMVKVGNWQEAKDVAEEELLGFLRLRERGQLAVQKTREVLSQALKQINLPPKKLIYFGDKLQLLARKAKTFKGRGLTEGLALSCVLNGSENAMMNETGIEGTVLSGSSLLEPCVRNVFELCPIGKTKELDEAGAAARLCYGMEFALKYTGSSEGLPYYVTVLPNRIIPPGNASKHPQVHLSSRKAWPCAWRAYHASLEKRKNTIGREIPANSEVIIVSANLNKNLACEYGAWFSTIFGIECEATVSTYLNIYGWEAENNIWEFN